MLALELVKDRETKEPAPEAATQLLERTRDNGLLIGKGGLYSNVIRLSPMLNIANPTWTKRFGCWTSHLRKYVPNLVAVLGHWGIVGVPTMP